nr:hypothetical protein QSJ49_13120 [Halobacterium salinarum]
MDCLLVGAGSVAEAYADGLAASTALRVTGVCDLHPERADALAAAHPSGPAVYTDLADALAADPAPMVINLTWPRRPRRRHRGVPGRRPTRVLREAAGDGRGPRR